MAANFIVVFDNASYSPQWEYVHGSNTILVTRDIGNSWAYREVSKGDTVSSGNEMGESVTFDTSTVYGNRNPVTEAG